MAKVRFTGSAALKAARKSDAAQRIEYPGCENPPHIIRTISVALGSDSVSKFRSITHVDQVCQMMTSLQPGLIFGELSKVQLQKLARRAEAVVLQSELDDVFNSDQKGSRS